MPEQVGVKGPFGPEDVVVGVLAYLASRENEAKFRADAVAVHKVVADLKREDRFRELFRGLAFDRRDYFPYSDTLEEILDVLQLAGYLERTNPRGLYYQIRPALTSMFQKEILPKFSEEQLNLIEEAAASFRAAVTA